MLPALVLLGAAGQTTARTPYAQHEPLRLGDVRFPASVPRFGLLEAKVDAAGTYDDPFDPTQVRLDARVTGPDGTSATVPGYLGQDFRRTLVDGTERLTPEGSPSWRLRLCPDKEGVYLVHVTFRDGSGEKSVESSFRCVASDDHGFVSVGGNGRTFQFVQGGGYWPLGVNLPSTGPRGTFDYDDWLAGLGASGANYVRLWLGPSWSTFAQELPGKPEAGKGAGQIDLADAWRLDRALDDARAHGLYAQLCLDSYGELLQSGPNSWWDHTPQNSDNGGPLRIWREFWSDARMERLYQSRLRYLVARYGADTHVFAWEFWNEVDRVSEFDPAVVRDWHQRMARYLDSVDAYHHLKTTSLGATPGLRTIDLIPELDFMQTHTFGSPDPAGDVAAQQSRKSAWGKPHFFGAVAAEEDDPRTAVDPTGLQAHDPLWAAIATGSSGGAMAWLGTHPILSKETLGIESAASRFLAGIDWSEERFRQTDVVIAPADPKAWIAPGDLVLDDGPVSFSPGSMKPQATVISDGQLLGPMPAGILHGTSLHPELHNPLSLRVRVAQNTRLEIGVSTVSGRGGASLRVSMDGAKVLSRDFPDPDGDAKTDDLHDYAGVIPVALNKGVHTLLIENVGADWMKVDYRLVGVVPRRRPPLSAWSVVGDSTALAWLRLSDRTWRSVAEQRHTFTPSPPAIMRLRGLRSGMWRAEVWDTWEGRAITTVRTRVGIDGVVRVGLPRIERDVAVKLVREGA